MEICRGQPISLFAYEYWQMNSDKINIPKLLPNSITGRGRFKCSSLLRVPKHRPTLSNALQCCQMPLQTPSNALQCCSTPSQRRPMPSNADANAVQCHPTPSMLSNVVQCHPTPSNAVWRRPLWRDLLRGEITSFASFIQYFSRFGRMKPHGPI